MNPRNPAFWPFAFIVALAAALVLSPGVGLAKDNSSPGDVARQRVADRISGSGGEQTIISGSDGGAAAGVVHCSNGNVLAATAAGPNGRATLEDLKDCNAKGAMTKPGPGAFAAAASGVPKMVKKPEAVRKPAKMKVTPAKAPRSRAARPPRAAALPSTGVGPAGQPAALAGITALALAGAGAYAARRPRPGSIA